MRYVEWTENSFPLFSWILITNLHCEAHFWVHCHHQHHPSRAQEARRRTSCTYWYDYVRI